MPKIVIREFDKTKAVGPEYASFAVVVPGFIGDEAKRLLGTPESVFDKNGIYECSNRDDFVKNVNIVSNATVLVDEATGPVMDETFGEEPKALTQAEFNEFLAKGNLYVATTRGAEPVGELVDETYTYEKVIANNGYVFKTEVVETPEEDEGTSTASETETVNTLFAVLKNEGHNDIYETHYGNQIAYELLGLGYTVLYKHIETTADLTDSSWWKPLKDKSEYDFRYIISGLLGTSAAICSEMIAVAEFKPENKAFDDVVPLSVGRGDCIALLDIEPSVYQQDKKTQEEIIESVYNISGNIPTSKYAAVFIPTVTYTKASMDSKYENRTFPASFHYLACAARSSERFSEWYANAGYTRGISNYTVETTGCNLGEAAVNAFQRRCSNEDISLAINPIIKLRGSYYLWGNRTTEALGNRKVDLNADLRASHFLNIRQLCCTIKKQVYVACRQFTFDPNSATLWTNFCNTIRPTLEKMKADQGISDYKILKVKSDRKAFLSAIIRIVPIEAVEDFDISVYLEDAISGTIANTEESE